MVIADNLAFTVDKVYNNVTDYTGLPLLIATYFFAFQIFCDFAGYYFIAIGAAKILGFDLMENFRRPYFAQSIPEFWRRWHISLSTWFKDYLYIPLGGNRVVKWRWYYNLFITFLISGLWHGASWTFVAWGALHGAYMVISQTTIQLRKKMVDFFNLDKFPKLLSLFRVFLTFHLVLFSWIFFRASTIRDALYIIKNIFNGIIEDVFMTNIPLSKSGFLQVVFFILLLELIHFLQEKKLVTDKFGSLPIYLRWFAYGTLIMFILLFGEFTNKEFIYFQF